MMIGDKKRKKLLARLSYGSVLDIGYNENPNEFLRGAIGFDLEITKKPSNYKTFIQGDCHKLSSYFSLKSFDTVIAGEIIEHLESPSQFLREVRKILKDQGQLLLTTPNPYNPRSFLANILFLKPNYSVHINSFNFRTLAELAYHTGFKIVKVINATSGFAPFPSKPNFIIPCFKAFSSPLLYVIKKNFTLIKEPSYRKLESKVDKET